MTARFKSNIVYYFSSSNTSNGNVSQAVAYINDWRDLDIPGGEIHVIATANDGCSFDGWGYKLPGDQSIWERVPIQYVKDENQLLLDNSRISEIFPSGTEFEAQFSSSGSGGDIENKIVVTIKIAEWLRNSWFVGKPEQNFVRWYPYTDSNAYNTTITMSYKSGDICRFNYSLGGDSQGIYSYNGIYDANHNRISVAEVNDQDAKNRIYFTVTKNVTYYVEAMYIRN